VRAFRDGVCEVNAKLEIKVHFPVARNQRPARIAHNKSPDFLIINYFGGNIARWSIDWQPGKIKKGTVNPCCGPYTALSILQPI
jgi:hypothetical protein